MAFCCPKPLVEQQIAASHAALAHGLLRLQARSLPAAGASRPTVLQISPILSPASSGACPHPLPRSSGSPSLLQVTAPAQGSQSQFRGHSPALRFTVPAHAAACSIREGFFSPCTSGLTLPGAAGRFPVGAGMVAPQLPLTAPLLRTHPGGELWVSQTVQL